MNHEPEHSPALWEKVLCSDFTFPKDVLHTATENPPPIRSSAMLNKGTRALDTHCDIPKIPSGIWVTLYYDEQISLPVVGPNEVSDITESI